MSIFASLQHLFQSLGSKGKDKKKEEKKESLPEVPSNQKQVSHPKPHFPEKTSETDPRVEPEKRPPHLDKKPQKTHPTKSDPAKNRTGIRIIKDDADLEKMLLASERLQDEAGEKISSHHKRIKNLSKKGAARGRNRHGIPILRDEIDFSLAFNAKGKEIEPEEDFATLLEKSLGSKKLDTLLHEKKQKLPSAPMTLKERIARYPAPEETLDLHGFSGIQASLKTEIFLEEAKRKGLFTVRIITGKGLHSDGPAILPGIVEQKILDLKKKDLILTHKWENKSGKTHGSVQVFLKHFK